jgi:hypothetical protein
MISRFVVGTCAAIAAAAVCGAVAAKPQSAAPTRAAVVQAVVDCRKIDDPTQRLACYDAAVAAMSSAETSGDLVTLDRKQRQSVRKQAFGFVMPALAMFDTGEKEVDRIDETLASASQGVGGRWVFVMQDGAIWRQIDDEFLSRAPHNGSAVVISKAMLGSFMLSVDGQPGVRAHRDQ